MSKKTPNIGLALNGVKSEDTQMTFREWRLRVNGEDNDSNMEILDAEIGAAKEKIDELEGQSLSDEDRQKLARIKDMTPATADGNGEAGFVPAPHSGDQVKYLRGDGTWGVPEGTNKPATDKADGLMSKEDKQKLDQFASSDQYAKKDDIPKNVETDPTLTQADTPADAKAVGEKFDSLTAEDVGARPSTWTPTADDVGAMPADADVVKTVNGRQPDKDGNVHVAETDGNIYIGSGNPPDDTYVICIDPDGEPGDVIDQYAREQLENKLDRTATAKDVGARPDTWMPTAADVGARSNTWMPTAKDVGALPSSTAIPSKTSDLTNDSGYISGTDKTLAQDGQAADAKATGEAISQLKTDKADKTGLTAYRTARNLLDNSDFIHPVNQRGSGSIRNKYEYPIDRWQFDKSSESLDASAIFNPTYPYLYLRNNDSTADSWAALYHRVPADVLNAGKYTFAFKLHYNNTMINPVSVLILMDSDTDNSTTVLPSALYTPDKSKDLIIVIPFTLDKKPTTSVLLAIYAGAGVTVGFDWAALYEGTYTNDTLPPYVPKGYSAELAECKRYYEVINAGMKYGGFSCGVMNTATSAYFLIPYSEKRIVPSVVLTGTFRVYVNGAGRAISASDIATDQPSNRRLRLICSNISNGTIGQACELQPNGDATTTIAISADL